MSNYKITPKTITGSKGKSYKQITITPTNNKWMTMKQLNTIYKKIIENNNGKHIAIKAESPLAWTTLKTFDTESENLNWLDEDYYRSFDETTRQKFNKYKNIVFFIK